MRISPLEREGLSPQGELSYLNDHFAEAKTKEALRVLILQRFAKWLDDVLAEEKPLEGVAAELLTELYDERIPIPPARLKAPLTCIQPGQR